MRAAAIPKRAEPIRRHRQRGNAAIEFALLFPLFFLIFYAIVTFSVIFVAQQCLTLAAEDGARAALVYQQADTPADALASRAEAACETASQLVQDASAFVGNANCAQTSGQCAYDSTMDCVNVTLTYGYAANPILPAIPLMNLALPANLTGSATVQIDPENIL
ncbi:pilus assembly protein TadE [Burkholderia sp. WAC0059]|uniref:TadE/TadG family type IV pilus assembly protein n=1 Tax=Burkholderia sp. WAC0059 TaxID=2066022 RepID=UPI000C7F778D|nr:TadE/TadG family type IV pilus assembly protein [Burkholderia sp. WAC0059]PLZ03357.1 pilus assembly protein TadE [Burkholderia sp. WAC0059]